MLVLQNVMFVFFTDDLVQFLVDVLLLFQFSFGQLFDHNC